MAKTTKKSAAKKPAKAKAAPEIEARPEHEIAHEERQLRSRNFGF